MSNGQSNSALLAGVSPLDLETWNTGPWAVLLFSNLGITERIADTDGATIIVPTGAELEIAIFTVYGDLNLIYAPVPVQTYAEGVQQFLAGAADVLIVPFAAVDQQVLDPTVTLLEQGITQDYSVTQIDALPKTTGGNGPDQLGGDASDNLIYGLGGDDRFISSLGNDRIDGGDGTDILLHNGITDAVQVYLNFGLSLGAAGRNVLTDIENVDGTRFDDRLVGDTGDNILRGLDGDDRIKGKGGNDTLVGGDGDDFLRAEDGTDDLSGGSGSDILLGLGGNDMLDGGLDRDFLYGGRGDDVLEGSFGGDELRGNLGNDDLRGGDGVDDLRGGGGNDSLNGGELDDFLFGNNGRDVLVGGGGNDSLTGGNGGGQADGFADTFVYSGTSDGGGGFDRVKDFENGLDLLDLQSFGFTDFDTEVFTRATDVSGGMRLFFGGGDVFFIEGFEKSLFDDSDVLL